MTTAYRIAEQSTMDIAQRLAVLRATLESELNQTLEATDLNAAMLFDEIAQTLGLNDTERLIAIGPDNKQVVEMALNVQVHIVNT